LPHCEHRIRVASFTSVADSACDPSERLRLDVTRCAAGTPDAHQKVAEAIIEPLDVRQHAHERMVRV